MGNAGLGAALQYLGRTAPGLGAAWDDFGKQKQKMVAEVEAQRRQADKDAIDALVKMQYVKSISRDPGTPPNENRAALLGAIGLQRPSESFQHSRLGRLIPAPA